MTDLPRRRTRGRVAGVLAGKFGQLALVVLAVVAALSVGWRQLAWSRSTPDAFRLEVIPASPDATRVAPRAPQEPVRPDTGHGVPRAVLLTKLAEARNADLESDSFVATRLSTSPLAGRLAEIPRSRRWEFYVREGMTVPEYARMLDGLGLELGVVDGSQDVQYASHLERPVPERRTARAADERRLYMAWRRGGMSEADQELLAAAGIPAVGKIVVHFLPESVEESLAALEAAFAGRDSGSILRTRFGAVLKEGKYRFYVMDQARLP